jgi:opacity protein-like surface antigen
MRPAVASRNAGDVMQFKRFALFVGFLLAAAGSAQAQLKDRVLIPAPIPDYGAVAVPAGVPVPDGFAYYLRADLGWGFATSRSYSENGVLYGAGPGVFTTAPSFGFGGSGFVAGDAKSDGVFLGTVGFGAYFTPRFRGDLTVDFRSSQELKSESTYSYISTAAGTPTVNGLVTDRVNINNAVILANVYWDILPRGHFTPYLGAGLGFVYNDATRTYMDFAVPTSGTSQTTIFSSKETGVSLAAALMAGTTFAIDQHWLIDVNYRALYLSDVDVVTNVTGSGLPFNSSRASVGNVWEQQARVGLRYNIW